MNKFQGVYTRKKPSFLFSPPSSRGLLRAEFAIDAVPQSVFENVFQRSLFAENVKRLSRRKFRSMRKISKINATTALNI